MADIVRFEERATGGLRLADELWDAGAREAIARFLDVRPDNPALPAMLAICASWGLDPFAGQVWLIKQKGRNADGAEHWKPAAGRDGYLAIANRQGDYKGVQGDVVRERDYFAVDWEPHPDGNGMFPRVQHRYVQDVTAAEPKLRGNILGAWAILFREGRLPGYYFAPWSEHMRDPGKSAWSYRSAMILKAAQSMTLRLGYSITGLAPVDEMAVGLPDPDRQPQRVSADPDPGPPPEQPWTEDDLPWGEDELAAELREAVRRSWMSGSREWTSARLAMLLTRDREQVLAQIQASLEGEEVSGVPA